MSAGSVSNRTVSNCTVESEYASDTSCGVGRLATGATLMHDAIRVRDALGLSNRDARSEVELLLMRALEYYPGAVDRSP